MTAHSHVRFQFRCLGNRSALTLKPHQKQTYLSRARSCIATHGVLLVYTTLYCTQSKYFDILSTVVAGTMSSPCGCPAGFSRCAGRCLTRLDQKVNYTQAESLCAELGAHLAVPRSEAENQCAVTAAAGERVWLGFTDVVTEGQFIGADGCGIVPSDGPTWAENQPNNIGGVHDYGMLGTPSDLWGQGWYDRDPDRNFRPLCQLALCYRPGCP